jgi:sugar (pentulose or hexulose) kinase
MDNSALWLVGGASNVGCAILRHLKFSNSELDDLSKEIDPNTDSPHAYYPLLTVGERFPVADRHKEPILDPVPTSRRDYLHGLLQGISDVERDGYMALGQLGVAPSIPSRIWTCGGGSRNDMWNRMRQRRLNDVFATVNPTTATVVVQRANNVEASYGAAVLAASSFS